MDEIYYIEEIQYWINNLKDELRYAQSSINNHGIDYLRKFINNRCNNIELYARALRDKIENG